MLGVTQKRVSLSRVVGAYTEWWGNPSHLLCFKPWQLTKAAAVDQGERAMAVLDFLYARLGVLLVEPDFRFGVLLTVSTVDSRGLLTN